MRGIAGTCVSPLGTFEQVAARASLGAVSVGFRRLHQTNGHQDARSYDIRLTCGGPCARLFPDRFRQEGVATYPGIRYPPAREDPIPPPGASALRMWCSLDTKDQPTLPSCEE